MTDIFAEYEHGLAELLKQLGKDHPRYTEALILQTRLVENTAEAQRYGDTEIRRAERAVIVDTLNRLALETLREDFHELCGGLQYLLPLYRPFQAPPRLPEIFNRVDELREIVRELKTSRRLMLCGLAGVGKTALAVEAVYLLQDAFPDGVLWVDLSTNPAPESVAAQLAGAYGVHPTSDPIGTVRTLLHYKNALVILDNAEVSVQLDVILTLLGACACLVITRERITSSLGRRLSLKPLPPEDARSLFLARLAQADTVCSSKEMRLVDQICLRVGYLPLAIEIAAGYVTTYEESIASYLQLLKDDPIAALDIGARRSESMRVTLGLTYTRLLPREQRAFWFIGSLAGIQFTLQMLSAGIQAPLRKTKTALNRLVACSLVRVSQETSRYTAHPLVRAYAKQVADPAEINEMDFRLMTYFAQYAYVPTETQISSTEWLDQVDLDRDAILAAARLAALQGRLDAGRRLYETLIGGDGLSGFLPRRGYWHDREQLLRVYLDSFGKNADGEFLASLHHGIAWSEWQKRSPGPAQSHFRKSLVPGHESFDMLPPVVGQSQVYYASGRNGRQCTEKRSVSIQTGYDSTYQNFCGRVLVYYGAVQDRVGAGMALCALGNVALDNGQLKEATDLYAQSLQVLEKTQASAYRIGWVIYGQARVEINRGNLDLARKKLEQSLELFERAQSTVGVCEAHLRLGEIARDLGDLDAARGHYRTALQGHEADKHYEGMLRSSTKLADVETASGDIESARSLLAAARLLCQRLGDYASLAQVYLQFARINLAEGDIRKASQSAEQAIELFQDTASKYRLAEILLALARDFALAGELSIAESLLVQCEDTTLDLEDGVVIRLNNTIQGIRRAMKNDISCS